MKYLSEKQFKARAGQLGATRFTEKHLEHTMSFLGDKILYTVLLNGKNKARGIPVTGHHSVSAVAKGMAETFKKRKLPHAGDALYFKNKLLGKSDLTKYFLFENISKIFVVLFAGILISLVSIFVTNQFTGYATVDILTFNFIEKSLIVGLAMFIVSVVVLTKIFFNKR